MKSERRQETAEFNPTLWAVRKSLFAANRYIVNLLLFAVGAAATLALMKHGAPGWSAAITAAFFGTATLSARIAFEWERVPVLRLGRLRTTRGPGLFFIIPFADIVLSYVDCRTTVIDFSTEKVLTRDAVPVYVDAIIFWLIWDGARAKLEVENYRAAVPLSAKTALRDIIGKTSLAQLLTDRDAIGLELQKILDEKTNPWGITSLSVEIKNIMIPEELEDAISREAQAEREKNARVILGSAEIELAEKYTAAARVYKNNDEAITLRSLNMLLDAVKNKGSMILVPSEVPHLINRAAAAAIARKSAESAEDDRRDHQTLSKPEEQ